MILLSNPGCLRSSQGLKKLQHQELYWKDPDNVPPARYLRASMSIPLFFYPVMVAEDLPTGPEAKARWEECASYEGEIPPKNLNLIESDNPLKLLNLKTLTLPFEL